MPIRTTRSTQGDPQQAAAEARRDLGDGGCLVVYFASSEYPQAELADAMQRQFAPARTIGCSTAGEISSGVMGRGSLVAMSITADEVDDFAVALVDDMTSRPQLATALAGFEAHFGEKVRDMDMGRYVGLVMMDGLTAGEERFMDWLGDHTDVLFVGGSAGDDLAFRQTAVHVNGHVSNRGAALALLRPRNGFEIIKTQSFADSGRRLVGGHAAK